jgi:cellulose synthase operon protein YhjQ
MGTRETEKDEQTAADGTPEDVAALYAWANLQGAKYRDYSASRREYRSLARYRAARALLEVCPAAATDVEDSARLAVIALREARELAEAHSSAIRQGVVYEESETQRLQLAGPQPHTWRVSDLPAHPGAQQNGQLRDPSPNPEQLLFAGWQDFAAPATSTAAAVESPVEEFGLDLGTTPIAQDAIDRGAEPGTAPAWLFSSPLFPFADSMPAPSLLTGPGPAAGDTLLESRERVASRWFALREVLDRTPQQFSPTPTTPASGLGPILAVYSLAGGVGKTSLVATLGRALANQGESVSLVDSTSLGLLQLHFQSDAGHAADARPSRNGHSTQPARVSVTTHEVGKVRNDDRRRAVLVDEILRGAEGKQRMLLDLAPDSGWLIRRLAGMDPAILVPVVPDMNSVVSLQMLEGMFAGITGSQGRAILPFYVLNQFDAAFPLHLDIRDIFRRLLGDRLLRVAIRRSETVGEALADGTTVLDYAPGSAVAQDYLEIARWLRSVSPSSAANFVSAWGRR